MKFIFQIILFCLLIFISFVFYDKYFLNEKINKNIKTEDLKIETVEKKYQKQNSENKITSNQDNLIKNLKYNVELKNSGKYEIKSNQSELIIQNDEEIIFMKVVTAIFTDNKNRKLLINSDTAEFNSTTYNTYFDGNIKIRFNDHLITSDKLTFDFIKNNILVHENVIYTGLDGTIETDNIKINLISKNVEIFMDNKNKNVKILSF